MSALGDGLAHDLAARVDERLDAEVSGLDAQPVQQLGVGPLVNSRGEVVGETVAER